MPPNAISDMHCQWCRHIARREADEAGCSVPFHRDRRNIAPAHAWTCRCRHPIADSGHARCARRMALAGHLWRSPPLDLAMTDTNTGKPVAAGDFRGKVVLLYFGYTLCPDFCPTTLTNLT